MNAGGFAVPDQRWRGLPWRLDPDEHWRLSYRIACDGMPDVKFSIVVDSPDGKTIKLDREPTHRPPFLTSAATANAVVRP